MCEKPRPSIHVDRVRGVASRSRAGSRE
jgi:hypothetical protein